MSMLGTVSLGTYIQEAVDEFFTMLISFLVTIKTPGGFKFCKEERFLVDHSLEDSYPGSEGPVPLSPWRESLS